MDKVMLAELESQLGFTIHSVSPVSGGDINQAYKIESASGPFFLKANTSSFAADMFACEVDGLQYLASNGLRTPGVRTHGTLPDGTAFLLLDFVQTTNRTSSSAHEAGQSLAVFHSRGKGGFGHSVNNYIGTIAQTNDTYQDWPKFYDEKRITPLIKLTGHLIGEHLMGCWSDIRRKLPDLISCDTPSPLHGDLWGGNLIYSSDGPVFIDPAVYAGDPIVDIAMTKLFGGFPASFYEGYNEVSPITGSEIEVKIELYQLYYLLVHVALFGRSYVPLVASILKRYA